jgi:hypothetical protein
MTRNDVRFITLDAATIAEAKTRGEAGFDLDDVINTSGRKVGRANKSESKNIRVGNIGLALSYFDGKDQNGKKTNFPAVATKKDEADSTGKTKVPQLWTEAQIEAHKALSTYTGADGKTVSVQHKLEDYTEIGYNGAMEDKSKFIPKVGGPVAKVQAAVQKYDLDLAAACDVLRPGMTVCVTKKDNILVKPVQKKDGTLDFQPVTSSIVVKATDIMIDGNERVSASGTSYKGANVSVNTGKIYQTKFSYPQLNEDGTAKTDDKGKVKYYAPVDLKLRGNTALRMDALVADALEGTGTKNKAAQAQQQAQQAQQIAPTASVATAAPAAPGVNPWG